MMKIALVGNPNCGKTTMFNSLTGSSQYVGNWPGVTVEKKEGVLKGHKDVKIIDLPGVYSLSPYTLEEVVSRNFLLDEKPDVIINLVDATNLERNLYLTTQVMEIGIPIVLALNMMDLVQKNGDKIDVAGLSRQLGCPVIETSAMKGVGCIAAAEKAIELANSTSLKKQMHITYSGEVEETLSQIEVIVKKQVGSQRWFAVKLFERDAETLEKINLSSANLEKIEQITLKLEGAEDDDSESIITNERYEWIGKVIQKCATRKKVALTTSDKIDRIVTNRFFALPIFIIVMVIVYGVSVSSVGTWVTDFTNETLFGEWIMPGVETLLMGWGAAEWLIGLVVDGILGGVGAVIGFLPQMFVLFFFLSILEDCGYMARVAFIMDRVFRKFGLSGKSFIPMLISAGCGVPGIMATKTIENEKDRRMTAMTTTFIPCGAKLPIIALMIGSLFGSEMAGWVAPLFYFIGVAAVIVSGIILKKTKMFAGDPAPFVMELPQYHIPGAKGVLIHMWERCRAFVIKAGTVIFVACAIIWFLSRFGWVDGSFSYLGEDMMDSSILAAIGSAVSWIFIPLGFGTWQGTVSTITGLVAKENVVGTFGVLYGVADASETDPGMWTAVGLMLPQTFQKFSFLAFNLLCAPCFAAIGALRRQMNSAKWTAFALGYQCALAYAVALMVNQFGLFMAGNGLTVGTVAAVLVLLGMLWLLFRPNPNRKMKLHKVNET